MYLSRLILNARSREVRRDLADCHALHRTVMCAFPDLSANATTDGRARAQLAVLFRSESHPRTGQASVVVQSAAEPDWSRLPGGYLLDTQGDPPNPDQKSVDTAYAAIRTGDELLFRLRANPTKRLPPSTGQDGVRRDGKRVELRTEAEQLRWLSEKGIGNAERSRPGAGFRLVTVQARPGLAGVRQGFVPPVAEDVDTRPAGRVTGWHDETCASGRVRGARLVAVEGAGGAARRERLTFGDVLFEGRLVVTDVELFRQALTQGIGSGKAYGFGLLSVARAPD